MKLLQKGQQSPPKRGEGKKKKAKAQIKTIEKQNQKNTPSSQCFRIELSV